MIGNILLSLPNPTYLHCQVMPYIIQNAGDVQACNHYQEPPSSSCHRGGEILILHMNLASIPRHDLTVCSAGSVAIAGTPEQPNEGGKQQDCS